MPRIEGGGVSSRAVSEDHRAVEALLYEYAARVDAADFAGVGELFAEASYRAAVGDDVMEVHGADAVRDLLTAMVAVGPSGAPGTQHVVTNVVVDVGDDGTATARSRFTVLQQTDHGGVPAIAVVAAGRYDDRFERSGDGWRFADRLIHTDLVGDLRRHLRHDPFA